MKNKLSENLKKIRKDNNLSQEDLAEELKVSRQAISKWESGIAYPEMEKIIIICQRFNVNIDDLLYKDVREVKDEELSKNNISKFMESFLKFITDTISLFGSMKFKSKVKCLFEQVIIGTILVILCMLFGQLFEFLLQGLFSFLPSEIYLVFYKLLNTIFYTFIIIVSLGILIYIFKVRYLNYYSILKEEVKTNDDVLNDKVKFEKNIIKDNGSKIIIRDPANYEYKFINTLLKAFTMSIKIITFLFLIVFCLLFICLFAGIICTFLISKTGIFFIGMVISLISMIAIDGIFILLLLNFIFNRKNNKKALIWSFIIFLATLGVGIGFLCVGSTKFNYVQDDKSYLKDESINIAMSQNLFFYEQSNFEFIEKDISNIEINYEENNFCKINPVNSGEGIYFMNYFSNPFAVLREFINNLNDKELLELNCEMSNIKVYASKENINLLKDNYAKFLQEQQEKDNYNMQIDYYERVIATYQDIINDLRNKIAIEQGN